MGEARMKPRASIPTTLSTRWTAKGEARASRVHRKASASPSKGVMSLKTIPGCGKSATSRIMLGRSTTSTELGPAFGGLTFLLLANKDRSARRLPGLSALLALLAGAGGAGPVHRGTGAASGGATAAATSAGAGTAAAATGRGLDTGRAGGAEEVAVVGPCRLGARRLGGRRLAAARR